MWMILYPYAKQIFSLNQELQQGKVLAQQQEKIDQTKMLCKTTIYSTGN